MRQIATGRQKRRQNREQVKASYRGVRGMGGGELPPWAPRGYDPAHIPEWEVDIGNSQKGRFLWGASVIYFSLNPESIKDSYTRTIKEATEKEPETIERKRELSFQLFSDNVFTISPHPMGPGKPGEHGGWEDPRVSGMLSRLSARRDAHFDTEGLRSLMEQPEITFQFGPWVVRCKMTKCDGSYELFDNDLNCTRALIDITLEVL